MIDKATVASIYELHELRLPRAWIAWTLGIAPADVSSALRLIGANTKTKEISREKYVQLANAVNSEWPLSEIVKTLHMDHRTVYRWFPEYEPLAQGHSVESKMIRDGNKLMSGRGGK